MNAGVAPEFNRTITAEGQALKWSFMRNYVEAQMVTYEGADYGLSSGWFYWNFKMEGGVFAEWSFLGGLRDGWIPSIPASDIASTDLYGSCYDILLKTDDSWSIIDEFPDPATHDTWSGDPIDDDVVLSHGDDLRKNKNGDWVVKIPAHGPNFFSRQMFWLATILVVGSVYLMTDLRRRRGYRKIDDRGGIPKGALEMMDECQ